MLVVFPCLHSDLYTNKLDAVTGWFLSHLLGEGDVACGGVMEKVGSRAEGVGKGCQSHGEVGIW